MNLSTGPWPRAPISSWKRAQVWSLDCTYRLQDDADPAAEKETEACTIETSHAAFVTSFASRRVIAAINLGVLALFVSVELAFSHYHFPTPPGMFVAATLAASLRVLEIAATRRGLQGNERLGSSLARLSIALGLVLPFLLAATTEQFHTHYFGLLILPVLECALYFTLTATLCVAAIASACAYFWVAYAAHFRPPFQLGELLEATTLVLVFFLVGPLVWVLLNRLLRREALLQRHVAELQSTRSQLVNEEKLAAVGRLASSVAHEIRNPVAIISSAMEAASSDNISGEEREEMARVALAEARRLQKLTTDFLTYAQPRKAVWTECDAASLSGYLGTIARAQGLAKEVNVRVDAAEGCLVLGNQDELQQTLLNLIRNAVDASPARGTVSILVSRSPQEITISVENQGPAIPDYAVSQIFEPFFTAKQGGTGLGLSIARKFAEAHGGLVRLEQNREGHVIFALHLPAYLPGEHRQV